MEIVEKQARSIKYQITIAKLPLAKDGGDFVFDGTPLNETSVHDLACGNFIVHQRNVVLVGGTESASQCPSRYLFTKPKCFGADRQTASVGGDGRRRRFSAEAKLRIVEESCSGPRLGSATARRYGITRSQLNDWRDAARAGRFGPLSSAGFVPAVIVPEVAVTSGSLTAEGRGRIEIMTANEQRVIVDRDVDVEALLRIVQALERLA